MNRFKAIDLFAGAGGLSEGLRMADIEVVVANEIDSWAAKTHEHNHPETKFIQKDIQELRKHDLIEALSEKGLKFSDIDIVVGGPPCQGFSIIGQRDPNDPRNRLFKEFVKVIQLVKPKAFIMENVLGILSMEDGNVKEEILNSLRTCIDKGYIISEPEVLLAADYGVPQLRKRVFFLGIRGDLTDKPLRYPERTHMPIGKNDSFVKLKPYVSVEDAIGNLPEDVVESIRHNPSPVMSYPNKLKTEYQKYIQGKATVIKNHHTKKLLETRLLRISRLKEGELQTVLPDELRAGGHENKYRRLHSKKPAPTLTAHMSKDLSDFIHYEYGRSITVREAARLQSFPDHYEFLGSEFQQLKQVGNAVPPLLGKAVAQAVVKQLNFILLKQESIGALKEIAVSIVD
ncbi:DNA cytosine methyltransferase [Paenibacillus glycanilyticus]|uniref:DNA cytosine methyltransferase n=1 Tax=Paenibacillus glycanilyticus TaxID=126569 RepID=UPI003EBB5FFF